LNYNKHKNPKKNISSIASEMAETTGILGALVHMEETMSLQ
jgi:hypothetical protein